MAEDDYNDMDMGFASPPPSLARFRRYSFAPSLGFTGTFGGAGGEGG
jgi:hypothetical protein